MNLNEMIGQRMVSGFPGPKMSEAFIEAVKKYKLGNVILFKWNVESAAQLKNLCTEIQALVTRETGQPAFITIDQEGGTVTRMPNDAVCVPGAMTIAATGDPENAYEAGLITAKELRALSINFDLAPVLDVNSNRANPVIGVRSYGDDPDKVAAFGVRMMRGLTDGGVLSSAKHFPGHGDTTVDSHLGLPCIDKSIEELESCELIPFRAAIDAGIPAVMTTHILFPQIEKEHLPATMSRTIMTGILRQRLNFKGLIISDCMMMKAIAEHYGTVNGVVSAMRAGVDLVFVCHDPALACQAMDAVKAACLNGTISMDEMKESAERILKYKENLSPEAGAEKTSAIDAEHRAAVRRMMRDAVTLVRGNVPPLGDRPVFIGCPAFASTQASNPHCDSDVFSVAMQKRLGGDAITITQDPTDAEIQAAAEQTRGHSSVIVATVNGTLRRGQLRLVHALCALSMPTVCVAMRNPYDLAEIPKDACALAAYEYDDMSLDAVADVLNGLLTPRGMLPVQL